MVYFLHHDEFDIPVSHNTHPYTYSTPSPASPSFQDLNPRRTFQDAQKLFFYSRRYRH